MLKKIKFLTVVFIVSALFVSSCVKPSEHSTDNEVKDKEVLKVQSEKENENDDTEQEENSSENAPDDQNRIDEEAFEKEESAEVISADRWKIKPNYTYDFIETFGNSQYSIYKQGDAYGVMDIDGYYIGEKTYSELIYCSTHGLSSKDVKDTPEKLSEDLAVSPDCGYRKDETSDAIYVFDSTRDRVYVAGYKDGVFRIADITDTEFFAQNERYIVVLYDCDADIMMYEGIGMNSLSEVFKAENTEMHYGVIDTDMDYVIACIYDEVRDGNDCYIVKQNGKYGYRAISGKEYYPCVFDAANTAYGGRAWVKFDGKWGTIKF